MSLDGIRQDIGAGLRSLAKAPGLSLTTIALIAVVIGGNTAVYSFVHSLMAKPASGVAANGLVTIQHLQDGNPVGPTISYPDFEDLKARSTSFSALLAWDFEAFTVALDNATYAMRGVSVTGNYFSTLGVQLIRGRSFTADEERLDSSGLRVVISYRFWQDHFGGRDDVLGKSVVVNSLPATIVGVAPQDFHGLLLGDVSDLWVPIVAYTRARTADTELTQRDRRLILAVGRLEPGSSLSQARTELATISKQLTDEHPQTNRGHGMSVVPYSLTAAGDSLFAQRAPQFLAAFSLVTLLTLGVVCANIGNLMLARVITRERELAVRLSLGATRFRVIRLLLVEGLVLSLVAWAAACGFAWALSRLLLQLIIASESPLGFNLVDMTPDWSVLAYAMGLACVGTIAFSIAPAIRVWRQDLLSSLKPGEAGAAGMRARASRLLAVVQLAFCVLLLVIAGLGYRSVTLLSTAELGFDSKQILLLRVNTAGTVETPDEQAQLVSRIAAHLASVPGITHAASSRVVPPNFGLDESVRANALDPPIPVPRNRIGPAFFELLGTSPLAGREFTDADLQRSANVAVINRTFADTLWPGQSPLGRTLFLGQPAQPFEIVGVVPDARYMRFQGGDVPAFVFTPDTRADARPGLTSFYVKHQNAVDTLAPALRASLRQFNANLPIVSMTTMNAALASARSPMRILVLLLSSFAIGSLTIAAIGLYGVISFTMRRRTREFGVRIALGATASQVLASVLREAFALAGTGVVLGFLLSVAVASAARRLLVGITPTDVPTYVSVFLLLTSVALAASYLPARRASRIAPSMALREE